MLGVNPSHRASLNRTIYSLGGVAVFFALWQAIVITGCVSAVFLPSPRSVLRALVDMTLNGELGRAFAVSFWRVTRAMLLTISVSVPLGVAMGSFGRLNSFLSPVVVPLRYLPLTALTGLFVLWFGVGDQMKIWFLFTGTFVYLAPLVRDAIANVDEEYLEIARDLGLGRWNTIIKVTLPGALPRIWDGVIVCYAIGWTYVILSEIINPQSGLGYLISISGRLQRSDSVFAGLAAIAILALLADRLLTLIGRKWLSW